MRKKPTTVFVYLLGAYVLVQFIWWGYHMIDLSKAYEPNSKQLAKRIAMILGEGSVFLILLLFGLWKIISSIKKEMRLARQQSNFMLSVTHELKTPIAANKLYLQTLQKHNLPDEKKGELLQKAIDEANRLEGLVEQILTASRLEQQAFSLNKQRFQLSDFLNELIEIQQKRISIPIQIAPYKDISIATDRLVFSTILNNLIENANKYGHTEKGIAIDVSHDEFELKIRVRDFGIGISNENQSLLFKKFTRLENEETRSTKGTGLGLFIAYECARTLGGKLKFIPSTAPGACFEIQIPYE